VIHGARGIGFYSYNQVTGKKGVTFAQDQPALWDSLKEINAELAQLGPFLLEASPEATATIRDQRAGVEMLSVSQHNARRILLANPVNEPREVTLDFAGLMGGGSVLQPIGKGVPIPIDRSRGQDTKVKLEAYGTAAFSYGTPPPPK
jgi:hypothetical protein